MNRLFEIQIIQPNFDKLYREYEQMFINNQKKESRPVAIKVEGKLKNSKITNNISVGMGLLEADEIEDSSVDRNKISLSDSFSIKKLEIIGRDKIEQHGEKNKVEINNKQEKEGFWSKFFWYFIIALSVLVIGGLILHYGFGIK